MTPAQLRQARKKFDSLRTGYVAARKKADDHERAIDRRYGRGGIIYATASEMRRHDELRERQRRIGNDLFALIQSISPRNWESGVPAWWIYEELPFEDVVRPRSEPLSVPPPLAYGATHPMR
jgi:hypothetical protein